MKSGGSDMSRQEMLDDPGASYPQLRQFLGGYFHQDWPLDSVRWQDVADDFVAESTRSSVAQTADELASLLADGFSDEETEAVLEALGCSVNPAAFHLGARAWLAALQSRITRG
ncbi:MAG: contact-dependent growth inhibition system immunity protein [Candidatus Dormibacter sp.]